MKCKTHILCLALILLALVPTELRAQKDGEKMFGGKLMPYFVEGKDTVFYTSLKPTYVYGKKPRQKGRKWRQYYRQVYNFARVYPYALVAKDIVVAADSTIKANNLKYVRKDIYVDKLMEELFSTFEDTARHMTITQGGMLMKLIDRECGIPPYQIIRSFKNRYAAGFWQGIAKIFGNDLKKPYDPKGDDEPLEELVKKWEDGTFEQLYYEIFWKLPPVVELPPKYKKPNTEYKR